MDAQIVDALAGAACFSTPFVTGLLFGWLWLHYRFKTRELDVRILEAQAHLERSRLLAGAPAWVDPEDPDEIEAWQRARKETSRLTVKPGGDP